MTKEEKWEAFFLTVAASAMLTLLVVGLIAVNDDRETKSLEERKVEALETIAAKSELLTKQIDSLLYAK